MNLFNGNKEESSKIIIIYTNSDFSKTNNRKNPLRRMTSQQYILLFNHKIWLFLHTMFSINETNRS